MDRLAKMLVILCKINVRSKMQRVKSAIRTELARIELVKKANICY